MPQFEFLKKHVPILRAENLNIRIVEHGHQLVACPVGIIDFIVTVIYLNFCITSSLLSPEHSLENGDEWLVEGKMDGTAWIESNIFLDLDVLHRWDISSFAFTDWFFSIN